MNGEMILFLELVPENAPDIVVEVVEICSGSAFSGTIFGFLTLCSSHNIV